MAKYFFNLAAPYTFWDPDGVELADIWSAQLKAARICGELVKSYPERCWSDEPWRMEVCDRGGLVLFSINILPIGGASALRTSELME